MEKMKILAGILISLYLGLTLFGLYQYKAHNRSWGMKLVVWMSGLVLLVGMGMRFKSVFLPVFLGIGFCLAYLFGWRLIGTQFTGWKRHLIRGLTFALCLGPLAAVRYSQLAYFDDWLKVPPSTSFLDILRFFSYGLPAFFLIGAIGFLISAGQEICQRADGTFAAVTLNWRVKLGYGLILLALLLSVNWYVAGAFLHSSAARGQTQVLQWVLWSRPGSVNAKNKVRQTPLHRAAHRGHAEVAKVLLKAGAKVNGEDKRRETPLHKAAGNGHTEVVKILLKAGAEVNAKKKGGLMPLHWAAVTGHTEVVKALIEAGAEVDACSDDGQTPLHLAVSRGRIEVVKLLIEVGVDVNAATRVKKLQTFRWGSLTIRPQTPLDFARTQRMKDLLREHGAKTGAELDAEARQKRAKQRNQE